MQNPPYLSAGNNHLNLAARSTDELSKLGADTGEESEAVVLSEGGQEVLDGVVGAGVLLELGDDGALVGGAEGGGLEDGNELRVLLDHVVEGGDALGGWLEGRSLDGGRVLLENSK